jgi:hypothetical protein
MHGLFNLDQASTGGLEVEGAAWTSSQNYRIEEDLHQPSNTTMPGQARIRKSEQTCIH